MTSVPMHGDFARALLDPQLALPAGLRSWNGSDAARRFAVYRNNVVVSLVNALAETFPVVQRLVGEPFFRAMAREYVCDRPPRSAVLATYGEDFADWMVGFPPVRHLSYLPDVARLESARVQAFHAADAPALGAEDIAPLLQAPQALTAARLALHPSLQVIDSAYGVVSLWAAHQHDDDEAIATVSIETPEAAVVLRRHDEVSVLPIDGASAAFVAALAGGRTLVEALLHAAGARSPAQPGRACRSADDSVPTCPQTHTSAAPFDPARALALLISHEAIVACIPQGA
jgi:hypothetical protein